ncbi:transposase [Paraburkholderia dipogonis]|uniref:transposase n=1 Tax=Paraburkholderia dipogonis TaxID=1211383 RepID=UPI001AD7F0AE|nr:transposase [Paraburkholderia dipogonis]
MEFNTRVLRIRLKGKHAPLLRERARGQLRVELLCRAVAERVWQRAALPVGLRLSSVRQRRRQGGTAVALPDGFRATSDGQITRLARQYRKLETTLALVQRAAKKSRVRALHAKIKNSRKDRLHKLSKVLVEEYGAIFIGNVNASALAKTRMAKSALDAGWSLF